MNANGSRISGLTRDLWTKWLETRESWRDAKALEFEGRYLGDLLGTVDKSVGIIEQIDKMIAKIRRDCE